MDGWLFWLFLLCTCLLEVVAFDSSSGSVPSIDVYGPEHPMAALLSCRHPPLKWRIS